MNSTPPPGPLSQRVFQRLDDQAFQSGEALAADLSVTRAAVWKAVEQLREMGVALDAQPNKGYRLAPGVSALSVERIQALCPGAERIRPCWWNGRWSTSSVVRSTAPGRTLAPPVVVANRTDWPWDRGAAGRASPEAPCRHWLANSRAPTDLRAVAGGGLELVSRWRR
jgi:BirA family biotin operon repressor/biotin-[acetyl-CoA-carboxylase] ligase